MVCLKRSLWIEQSQSPIAGLLVAPYTESRDDFHQ